MRRIRLENVGQVDEEQANMCTDIKETIEFFRNAMYSALKCDEIKARIFESESVSRHHEKSVRASEPPSSGITRFHTRPYYSAKFTINILKF